MFQAEDGKPVIQFSPGYPVFMLDRNAKPMWIMFVKWFNDKSEAEKYIANRLGDPNDNGGPFVILPMYG